MSDDMAERELARSVLASVGLELSEAPVPTAEAEMQRLVAEEAEIDRIVAEAADAGIRMYEAMGPIGPRQFKPAEAQQIPEPRTQTPQPKISYQQLSTGQKLELILDRQEHQEKVLQLLSSKIDRVGLNTVNLSKNNQAIAAMLQALVGAMTEPEQPESLIQTVRGGF